MLHTNQSHFIHLHSTISFFICDFPFYLVKDWAYPESLCQIQPSYLLLINYWHNEGQRNSLLISSLSCLRELKYTQTGTGKYPLLSNYDTTHPISLNQSKEKTLGIIGTYNQPIVFGDFSIFFNPYWNWTLHTHKDNKKPPKYIKILLYYYILNQLHTKGISS